MIRKDGMFLDYSQVISAKNNTGDLFGGAMGIGSGISTLLYLSS